MRPGCRPTVRCVSAVSVGQSNRSGCATVRDGAFSIRGLVPGAYMRPRRDRRAAARRPEPCLTRARDGIRGAGPDGRRRDECDAGAEPGGRRSADASSSRALLPRHRSSPAWSRARIRWTPGRFCSPNRRRAAPVRDDATFELPEIFRLPPAHYAAGPARRLEGEARAARGPRRHLCPDRFRREPRADRSDDHEPPGAPRGPGEGRGGTGRDRRARPGRACRRKGRGGCRSARSTAGPRPTATSSSARCPPATTSSSHSASTN